MGWASGSLTADKSCYTPHADARRAEISNTNYLDIYLLNESLEYLLGYFGGSFHQFVHGPPTRSTRTKFALGCGHG